MNTTPKQVFDGIGVISVRQLYKKETGHICPGAAHNKGTRLVKGDVEVTNLVNGNRCRFTCLETAASAAEKYGYRVNK